MTFTYDPTLVDDISKVRVYIGDTIEATALVADEAINLALADSTNVYGAAAICIDFMVAALRDSAIDIRVESVSESGSQRINSLNILKAAYLDKSAQLNSAANPPAIRWTGGSLAAMADRMANDDLPPSRFVEGQFDTPYGGGDVSQ